MSATGELGTVQLVKGGLEIGSDPYTHFLRFNPLPSRPAGSDQRRSILQFLRIKELPRNSEKSPMIL